jgi:hypothetical protein
MNTPAITEKLLADSTYQESVRVTEAYRIVLRKRKYATYLDPNERARLVDEAEGQLAAAERAEYAAWQQVEYHLKMAIKQPWASGVTA